MFTPKRLAAAIALIGAIVWGSGSHGVASVRSHPSVTHIVRAGETVWNIALASDAIRDTREVVYDILQLNGLRNPIVSVGQSLLLP